MNLNELNQLSEAEFCQRLRQCCTSESWVTKLAEHRPFADMAQFKINADECWIGLNEADYLQAFDGHPKIGDVNSLKAKYANTKALASNEQSGVNSASDAVITALSEGNQAYEQRYGFIFIVFASGKSAEQMLGLLQARLNNERHRELVIAADEQRKIFQLRLDHLIDGCD